MNKRIVVVSLTVLMVLVLTAWVFVYLKPWIVRVVALHPYTLSATFEELERLFEGENGGVDLELKPYHVSGELYTLLDEGEVDIVVAEDLSVMEMLSENGYVNWYLQFATGDGGTAYYIAVSRNSKHLEQALAFTQLLLSEKGKDVLRKYGYEPVTPAMGFGDVPEELREYALEFKSVVDWLGRRVIVPKPVKRVVSLVPMITISILMMDGGDLLVGVDSVSPTSELLTKIFPQIKDIPVAGAPWSINIELILSLDPDVVLTTDRPMEVVKKLEELEIPVVIVPMGRLHCDQLPEAIRLIGEVIGREDKAEELASYCEEKMTTLLNVTSEIPRSERAKVYIAISDGLKTHIAYISRDIVWIAGGVNVAENLSGPAGSGPPMAAVSMETVLTWNPDIIITWDPQVKELILSDPRWAEVNAVKNNRVYVIPRGLRSWITPEPEAFLGAMWLAEKLNPDAFSFNFEEEVKLFYHRFLGYELSDEELSRILSVEYGVEIPGA